MLSRLFLYLPAMLLLYRLIPREKRYILLCAVSLIFYLAFGLLSLLYVLAAALAAYAFSRKRELCRIGVFSLILLWLSSRYLYESLDTLRIIGISFYSLRVISYLVEVRRGRIDRERDFLKLLLFVSYFPLALQGPVAEHGEISKRLYGGKLASGGESLSALIRILYGLFKKTVIADALAQPLSLVTEERRGGAYVLFLLVFYSARIYCDFSGGIDIMLGISRLFGIELPENFDRPFCSLSLREFWNRWHITLGEWFERYVFYPLSLSMPMQRLSRHVRSRLGNKRGRKLPMYFATLCTWLLTGLWHGARANFIAWGLTNGILVIVSSELSRSGERISARYPRAERSRTLTALRRTRVFFVIGAVRLLDVYGSVGLTFSRLVSIFSDVASYRTAFSGGLLEIMPLWRLFAVLGALFAVFLVSSLGIKSNDAAKKPFFSAAAVFSLAFCILVFGVYGRGFDGGEFIYSRY